jgi:hypothetical protein
MKRLAFVFLILLTACTGSKNESTKDDQDEMVNSLPTEPVYQVITTELPDKGYGYQILKDGKLIIDQQQIPAVQGNQYFSSEENAKKTGELALKKIRNQMFPPTISVEELDSLGVL